MKIEKSQKNERSLGFRKPPRNIRSRCGMCVGTLAWVANEARRLKGSTASWRLMMRNLEVCAGS